MQNIIKDNRIVSDITFAVRFLSYLVGNYNNGSFAHPMLEEEYEYMLSTAIKLLKQQVETCPEKEKWYFLNLCKDYTSYKDIIKYHICKDKENVYNYLIKNGFLF